jgi:Tfp pilus assembly protein PilF
LLKPGYAEAHNKLGLVFQEQGKLDEAVASYPKALSFKPDLAKSWRTPTNSGRAGASNFL